MSLNISEFKQVASNFATGVVVITATTSEGPVGFTCQTFGSLSLEPLLAYFTAQTGGSSWPRIKGAESIGISILSQDQEQIAQQFAASGVDKFSGVEWKPGPGGAPLLDGALSHVEGTLKSVTTHGDHEIAVLEVTYGQINKFNKDRPTESKPLLYFHGSFGLPA
jgi:flavin reductase (DIM6/NTAB) family NADH-FMN oxidoreductase RutF